MADRKRFTLDGGGEPGGNGGENGSGEQPNNPGTGGTVDPAAAFSGAAPSGDGGTATGETGKRRRGRPPGSGKAKASASVSIDPASVEVLLFNIHGMLAMATGVQQLALNETEAGTLAKAVCEVQQFYPTHISAKSLAWANLIMVGGSIYGTRAVAIWAESQAKQNAAPQQPQDGVTVLRPNNGEGRPFR